MTLLVQQELLRVIRESLLHRRRNVGSLAQTWKRDGDIDGRRHACNGTLVAPGLVIVPPTDEPAGDCIEMLASLVRRAVAIEIRTQLLHGRAGHIIIVEGFAHL